VKVSILIVGGSTGIGRSIAEHFGSLGADVYINYHSNDESAQECIAAVEAAGGRAQALKADAGTTEGARELASWMAQRVERVDQVVYCAVKALAGPLLKIDPDELRECLEVNPLGMINVLREMLPMLGTGSTVFYVSSQGALSVLPNYGPLGIGKALGEHIVRYLAPELAEHGVRILTISPGAIDTTALRQVFPDTYEKHLEAAAARNLAGRALLGSDVGKVIELLSQPGFDMTFAERIKVDGGVNR
jgi:NAD(P)-dependent dehydrogenase (short-subunit alcohol dehydrogenase family)